MREIFQKFFDEYLIASQNKWSKSEPFVQYVDTEVPESIAKTNIIDTSRYLIEGSTGKGVYTKLPWIAVFNREITTSAQRGVYIVYLFNTKCTKVYLTLNQGCTDLKNKQKLPNKEIYKYLENQSERIGKILDPHNFTIGNNINLDYEGSKFEANCYQKGSFFFKEYTKENLPSEEQMVDDLKEMMEIYEEYYKSIYVKEHQKSIDTSNQGSQKQTEIVNEGESSNMTEIQKAINEIKVYIKSKGFTYEGNLIENFYLSLKSKPFVILAGTSGTGKTRLAKLFAESIGATYKLVPVRPDWSDSSDLFGHLDLNDQFVPGAIIDFIKEASLPDNISKPYFLCLDEMNLARVEYYMSDFLSIIETRDFDNKKQIKTDPLMTKDKYGTKGDSATKYGDLCLPENLYIIGTVNMDETTFPFSKKVLDRANTIEFSLVDLMPKFEELGESAQPVIQDNSFLRSEYLKLVECKGEQKFIEEWTSELVEINKVLEDASLHVGYRVRDEIMFYMLNNKKAGNLITDDDAFDNEIMQKILPRIQGSSQSIKDLLCDLFKICAGDYSDFSTNNTSASEQMYSLIKENTNIKYPKSAKKIQFMTWRFEEDGFTSYWL